MDNGMGKKYSRAIGIKFCLRNTQILIHNIQLPEIICLWIIIPAQT